MLQLRPDTAKKKIKKINKYKKKKAEVGLSDGRMGLLGSPTISVDHTSVQVQTNTLDVSGSPHGTLLVTESLPFSACFKGLFINTDFFISKFEFINSYSYSGKQR